LSTPIVSTTPAGQRLRVLSVSPGIISRVPELAFPRDPNVGGELALKLVAETQTKLRVGETRAKANGSIVFGGKVHFGAGLKDETLRELEIVVSIEASKHLAALPTNSAPSTSNQ
jgi:hypothetical protein